MTDREKLVGLVKEICNTVVKACGCSDMLPTYSFCKNAVYESIADYLITNGVTVQEWIPVEDDLPYMNELVLVTDGSLVKEAYYNGRAEWICNGHDMEQGGVVITHWKHKPEPPKEEAK